MMYEDIVKSSLLKIMSNDLITMVFTVEINLRRFYAFINHSVMQCFNKNVWTFLEKQL